MLHLTLIANCKTSRFWQISLNVPIVSRNTRKERKVTSLLAWHWNAKESKLDKFSFVDFNCGRLLLFGNCYYGYSFCGCSSWTHFYIWRYLWSLDVHGSCLVVVWCRMTEYVCLWCTLMSNSLFLALFTDSALSAARFDGPYFSLRRQPVGLIIDKTSVVFESRHLSGCFICQNSPLDFHIGELSVRLIIHLIHL